tara:strand:- start:26 stop:358 length:333 start_codon:yes stop_codon:yes gene_type:complete
MQKLIFPEGFSINSSTNPGTNSEITQQFLREIIQLLKNSLRSEDPADYGVNEAKNLDIFAWEMVEDAKSSNAKINLAIDKLTQKLPEELPTNTQENTALFVDISTLEANT